MSRRLWSEMRGCKLLSDLNKHLFQSFPVFATKKLFEQAASRTISRERLTIQAAKLKKTLYIP